MSKSSKKWPCIFTDDRFRNDTLPHLWKTEPGAPIGVFTKLFRTQHCQTINPYGSEACPFDPRECSFEFLVIAEESMLARKSPIGLFRLIAKNRGMNRAENKPLARDAKVRTYGHESGATDLRDGPGAGSVDDVAGEPGRLFTRVPGVVDVGAGGVHGSGDRSTRGPQSIGSMLRGDGAGPRTHPYGWNERKETTDHDGDTGDVVSPPSSRRLGHQPSSGDSDVHQGGE